MAYYATIFKKYFLTAEMLTNLINKLSTQYDPNFGKKWKEVCVLIEKKIY